MRKFRKGDQVRYHVEGKTEYGFVTTVIYTNESASIFCRFWIDEDSVLLRTTSNSELCTPDQLTLYDSRPQQMVDKLIEDLGYAPVDRFSDSD